MKQLIVLFALALSMLTRAQTVGELQYISQDGAAWSTYPVVMSVYQFGYDETHDVWKQGNGIDQWPYLEEGFGPPGPMGDEGAEGPSGEVNVFVNGSEQNDVAWYHSTGTVGASGSVTFYLTTDHTSGGFATFAQVITSSARVRANSPVIWPDYSTMSVSGDRKTVTITMKTLGVVNLLTGVIGLATAPNGSTCTLSIQGY